MRLVGRGVLEQFGRGHAPARKPLDRWRALVEAGHWQTPQEMREAFGPVDFVEGHRAIFNIGGNKYRLVAQIVFAASLCRVEWVGTHAEYDKRSW
jgi:mRNA interferase HigB